MMFDLPRYWYRQRLHFVSACLLPFSLIFYLMSSLRRQLFRFNVFKTKKFNVPVIVVGNIVAGGTGKTPLVIWLAEKLREQGFRPGIVSRGIGGQRHAQPYRVQFDDSATDVGDEALLLSQCTACPVILCVDRVAAVQTLLASTDCNVVISDDGLQHYRMDRQIEIAVVDGDRRFGNGYLLPAGPLREPLSRLKQVDFVVVNGGREDEIAMHLKPVELVSVANLDKTVSLDAFINQPIHAIAGIGNPARFFKMVEKLGYQITPHAFSDHHLYTEKELTFNDNQKILMTEKDAVKCKGFADDRYWFVRVCARINNNILELHILQKLRGRLE